jgi:hypothetical protein
MTDSPPPSKFSWQRLSTGTRLNGIYEIDEPIGVGGMGEIYKGHVVETGDPVAIKMMLPELAENEAALTLFRKEASSLHHLHHDAIIRYYVFTVEPVLRRPYLAMEFVNGRSLSDILRDDGPLPFEAVRSLMQRLASGLQAAHDRQIIHRDVSPGNIIIPSGDVARAKIIDFGIARSTQHGTVIGSGFAGTANYVSPEQLGMFGGDVAARSDIYSLALVLVCALTGRPIDMGGSQLEIIEKRRKVPDLGAIDMRFRPLLEKMLQPDPSQRPDSMATVAAWSFGSVPAGRGKSGHDGSKPFPARGSLPRSVSPGTRRWGRTVAALLLMALIGGGAGLYYFYGTPIPSAPKLAAADIRRYVEQYDGGNCFFVAPTAISDHAAVIEGFGSSTRPFTAFDGEFQRKTGFEADIGVRQVTEPQCPAITFLARLRDQSAQAPHLDIDRESLRNGDVLNGTVDRYGTRNVDLILVSDAGTVQNVSNLLKPGTDAKTFNIGMRRTEGVAGRQPQLLVAVASTAPIEALRPARPAEAEQVFSRALDDAARSGTSLSAMARYFMLEN